MTRFLVYIIVLYLALPISAVVDLMTIVLFFVIIREDALPALLVSFFTGLLLDLYLPVRIGVNTIISITLTQSLLLMKKYLVINPLTTISTFVVFLLVKAALANLIISAPLNLLHILYTIAAFFPVVLILNRISFGAWMKA
jgi:hypothetical protein